MGIPTTISVDTRINEVIRAHPGTVDAFHRLGLDACCGGDRTIAEAAAAHGLPLGTVLQKLLESLHGPADGDA
jgi:regulator of cell morphogenesis and NO signaling